jgi:hypothetical protein
LLGARLSVGIAEDALDGGDGARRVRIAHAAGLIPS